MFLILILLLFVAITLYSDVRIRSENNYWDKRWRFSLWSEWVWVRLIGFAGSSLTIVFYVVFNA